MIKLLVGLETYVKMEEKLSGNILTVTFAAALILWFVGSLVNLITMIRILKDGKIRRSRLAPLLFFMALTDFIFCFIWLLISALRFRYRDQFFPNIEKIFGQKARDFFCDISPVMYWGHLGVTASILILISLHRGLAIWFNGLEEKFFSWKKVSIYFALCWILNYAYWIYAIKSKWAVVQYIEDIFSCTIVQAKMTFGKK